MGEGSKGVVPWGEGKGGAVPMGINENIALVAAETLLSQIAIMALLSKVSYRIVKLFIKI
jgi:hypothetical protein